MNGVSGRYRTRFELIPELTDPTTTTVMFKDGVATLALLLAMVAPAIAQSPRTPLEQRNESVIRQ